MLRFLLEVLAAVAMSLLVFTSQLGSQNYLVIATILAAIGALVIYSTRGFFHNDESAPTVIWISVTLSICIGLGLLWPALPIIVFYEHEKTRRWRKKWRERDEQTYEAQVKAEHKVPRE